MAVKLTFNQKEELGIKIINAAEKNLSHIISKKPDPELVYRKLEDKFDKIYFTQSNVLRIIKLLPKDYDINRWVSKIANYSIKDEHGNSLLHILVEKERLKDIYNKELWKLKLWEESNKKGVLVIDLLLLQVFSATNQETKQYGLNILNKIIEHKLLNDEELIRKIASAVCDVFINTGDLEYEKILLKFVKSYPKSLDKEQKTSIRNKLLEVKAPYEIIQSWY